MSDNALFAELRDPEPPAGPTDMSHLRRFAVEVRSKTRDAGWEVGRWVEGPGDDNNRRYAIGAALEALVGDLETAAVKTLSDAEAAFVLGYVTTPITVRTVAQWARRYFGWQGPSSAQKAYALIVKMITLHHELERMSDER